MFGNVLNNLIVEEEMLKVIKNQEYQTVKEVELAAKRGCKTSKKSSARHWRELATAPVSDLIKETPGISVGECALCARYNVDTCKKCPLYKALGKVECYHSGAIYNKAKEAIDSARYSPSKRQRDLYIKRFRRAAEELLNILVSIGG